MWILLALAASILWGLTYVINEQVYKKISVTTSLVLTNLGLFLVLLAVALTTGIFKKDLGVIAKSPKLMALIAAETLTFVLAELCIGYSITHKNATLAGLVEISYPIFIVLFAYLLYKQNQLTTATIIGGAFIFIGVFVIYYFNK